MLKAIMMPATRQVDPKSKDVHTYVSINSFDKNATFKLLRSRSVKNLHIAHSKAYSETNKPLSIVTITVNGDGGGLTFVRHKLC